MLTMPIMVLFYESNGLHMKDVLLLQGVYSFIIVLFEIPSGYAADILGRKNTIIIGSLFGCAGFFVYSFSTSFFYFFCAESFLGIGQSMISGADSALLYDSLQEQKNEKEYSRWEGKMISTGNFAEAIAGLLAGFLASYSLRLNFYGQTIAAFIAIPAAFLLVEPSRHKMNCHKPFINIKNVLKLVFFQNTQLRERIIISSLIGIATLNMAWFVQPYLMKIQLPVSYFGMIWTALNITVGIAALNTRVLERFKSDYIKLILIFFFVIVFYFLSGLFFSIWGLIVFFCFYIIRGFATPFLKNLVNEMSPSESRATILSIRNFIIRLGFSALGPLFGYLNDIYSLRTAFWGGSIFFLLSGMIILGILKKNNIKY